jgi:hypothetical protein
MYGGDATTQDVARFVAEHCGDALQARRVFLRDRFAQLAAPTTRTLRMPAPGERHSTSPVAVDVPRPRSFDEWSASPPVPGLAPPPERGLARWLMPAFALIAGAGLSVGIGEVRERVPIGSGAPTTGRTPRVAEVVAASKIDVVRAKAERASTPTEAPAHAKGIARPSTTATATDDAPIASPDPPAPTGFATIDSYPWANVTIDGADSGVTPIVRTPLRAGAHVVILENPAQGRHELTLTVRDGETTVERWRW